MSAKNLEELYELMIKNDPSIMDKGSWSTSLPTFGGPAPSDTTEVWSWDETRLLIGTCASDLQIVNPS
ncbi:MAG: hypothetical protein JJE49_09555 [Peptostreptococcaceae bacterium]|nr:hypothetical protein [Peptostreptococcaceae bacterium]